MSSEFNLNGASGQWERVARELRACKEKQQKAWGSIDNTTLGRYLAGESSDHELAEVENALQELPELRKLTDLVRDVLNDLDPVAFDSPEPEPILLTFPSKPVPLPRRRVAGLLQRRAPLVAAACLLLTFGLAMPRSGFLSAPNTGAMPRITNAVASVRPVPAGFPRGEGGNDREALPPAPELFELDSHQEPGNALFVVPTDSDDRREASTPHTAAEVNRRVLLYRSRGDLLRAVPLQQRAHRMCERKLGPNHPTTQKTVRELARAYQVALNAPPPIGAPYHIPGVSGTPGNPPASGFRPIRSPALTGGGLPPGGVKFVRLSEPRQEVSWSATVLRQQIEGRSTQDVQTAVVPVLVQALQTEPSAKERVNLVRALGSLGPAAGNAVGVLTERLETSRDPAEVRVVLDALNEIGPAARDALPVLAILSDQCCDRPAGPTRRHKGREGRPQPGEERTARFTVGDEKYVRLAFASLNGPAGRAGVDDRAGYFSVRAVCQANRTIRDLAQKARIEVLVETTGAPSRKGVARDSRSDGVRALGKRAIHVIFARDGAVVVHVSDALRTKGVTPEKLRTCLEECARRRQYDKALDEGIKIVQKIASAK